eukprot:s823_g17.t1
MTKEEVEEAENTPLEGDEKADDDEMKDEEPSDEVKMETDEVNVDDQFGEVHRDLGSFSFNEEEVDYDDDEDEEEEMEVEEEAEEPKMSPNDENVDLSRISSRDRHPGRLRESQESCAMRARKFLERIFADDSLRSSNEFAVTTHSGFLFLLFNYGQAPLEGLRPRGSFRGSARAGDRATSDKLRQWWAPGELRSDLSRLVRVGPDHGFLVTPQGPTAVRADVLPKQPALRAAMQVAEALKAPRATSAPCPSGRAESLPGGCKGWCGQVLPASVARIKGSCSEGIQCLCEADGRVFASCRMNCVEAATEAAAPAAKLLTTTTTQAVVTAAKTHDSSSSAPRQLLYDTRVFVDFLTQVEVFFVAIELVRRLNQCQGF